MMMYVLFNIFNIGCYFQKGFPIIQTSLKMHSNLLNVTTWLHLTASLFAFSAIEVRTEVFHNEVHTNIMLTFQRTMLSLKKENCS